MAAGPIAERNQGNNNNNDTKLDALCGSRFVSRNSVYSLKFLNCRVELKTLLLI
jgi:hypothetical protein